eukprot:XP_794218.2 PREDICTED: renilla-luciferin 2-monooxygenase [Strongylocentrotus purpuratus]
MASRNQATIPLVTADEWWGKCKKVDVLGSKMSYYDSDPQNRSGKHTAVFLHGNPTSSYLWRNVIPQVEPIARCLAPDLIGMGRSDKLASRSYRFLDHYRYLSAWFDALKLPEKITVVCHDWGTALGLHWCSEHRDRLEAIVHMEGVYQPMTWDIFPDSMRDIFLALRSDAGEEMILKKNMFIETILPLAIKRTLRQEEMDAYREPFKNPGEDRRPLLTFPRQIPIQGEGPEETVAIVTAYHAWIKGTEDLPKFRILPTPGIFSEWNTGITKDWPNHKVVQVEGSHFFQEDSPIQTGDYIKEFLSSIFK